ncbi:MAG: stage V sporulation protein AD [Ruminococcus sp.]|nr:stage V sporulation protein AD [Ruminococcus sp.]
MPQNLARGVFLFDTPPKIESFAAVVGEKEGSGPMGDFFDKVVTDSHFGQKTWEQAESRFQLEAVSLAVRKANLTKEDIDIICAGDLINQCTGSSYGLRQLEIPFMGLYGACSTMAESLIAASLLTDSGAAKRSAAVTSSHFSTAERQFRAPLSYGGQRTPTAQWTCTASGSAIVSADKGNIAVYSACVGKITDMDITDISNMGAAMAPAAMGVLCRYFEATNSAPTDFDAIVTGDLGILGSQLLIELMAKQGYDISSVHKDCGEMIFDKDTQDTHCGGSGCGCSASVLCGYFLPMLEQGSLKKILFIATGALMSAMSVQQGESIPTIAHLLELRRI